MKKTLFTLLTLVLALVLVFTAVSCEIGGPGSAEQSSVEQNDEEDTATEIIKDKKAATGDTVTEATLQEVVSKNQAVVTTNVEAIIKDIQALVKGTGTNVSSAGTTTVIKPQDGSSSFSFATVEDYAKAKENIKSLYPTVDESKLVPGQYSEIKIITKTSGGSGSVTVKYKKAGSSDYITSSDSDDQLVLDMLAIPDLKQDTHSSYTVLSGPKLILALAKNALKVTCELWMTESSGTKYTADVSVSISASGKKIINVDEITLKKGDNELATLTCNASLKFSDDFSVPYAAPGGSDVTGTGTVDVSIENIELNVGKGNLVLSGKLAAILNFNTEKLTMYAALSEKIGSDTIFDIEAGLYEASDIPEDLDKVTFYKCDILGKSYSSDSVMKAFSSMLSQES